MKKITDEYVNEILEPILTKYIENENIIDLYNEVIEKDEELLSLALFFAQRVDITKYLEMKMDELPDLEEQAQDIAKQLNENKEVIDRVSDIISFDDPNTKKLMDILNNAE